MTAPGPRGTRTRQSDQPTTTSDGPPAWVYNTDGTINPFRLQQWINQNFQQPSSGTPARATGPNTGTPERTSTTPGDDSDDGDTGRTFEDSLNALRAYFPFLPDAVIRLLVQGYIEHGDGQRALTEFRNSAQYEDYFAGNKRDDGTLRYDESAYYAYRERARIALLASGVNPDLFEDRITAAISGDLGISVLEARIDEVTDRVLTQGDEIRRQLALQYGLEGLSDAALVGAVLDSGVQQALVEQRITNAEIGAEAAFRGFVVELGLLDRIRQRGVNRQGASQLFGQAGEQLPILDILARRHEDPDDDFDLNEFLAASIFDDPAERRRMRRLVAQERGLFSPSGFSVDRAGRSSGLLEA